MAQAPQEATPAAKQDPEVFDAYLRALVALKDGPGVAAAIESAIPHQKDPRRLRFFGRTALQMNQPIAAAAAFHRLLELKEDDAEALRWMGLLYFQNTRYEEARLFLVRYLAQGEGDYQSLYSYGEILWRRGDTLGARPYYRLALRQIEETDPKPFGMRLIQAQVLNRLGHTKEAFGAFENLIKQWPEDANLRADYAGILIDHGKHKEAERVLAIP
jgi:tetratricopeptide (TPR) repeat protein